MMGNGEKDCDSEYPETWAASYLCIELHNVKLLF